MSTEWVRGTRCAVIFGGNRALRTAHASFNRAPGTAHQATALLPDAEQLKPPLVARDDPLPVRRVLRARQRRVARDDLPRGATCSLEQRKIGGEVRVAQRHASRLARPGQLAHAALREIELGDLESVG